jgi:hypothetical protein
VRCSIGRSRRRGIDEYIDLLPHVDGKRGRGETIYHLEHPDIHPLLVISCEASLGDDVRVDTDELEGHSFSRVPFEVCHRRASRCDAHGVDLIHIDSHLKRISLTE